MSARPFVKWAGGKTKVVHDIVSLMSELLSYETYYEPFVGGGALFFELNDLAMFKRACLNDKNAGLMDVYRVISRYPSQLVLALDRLVVKYKRSPDSCFERVRASDPENRHADRKDRHQDRVDAAARFIFLNKTCFNGMYRVNKSGQFNVPHGRYENPLICDPVNIDACMRALQRVSFGCLDFEDATMSAVAGDLVYFDPPYLPLSKTSSFVGYTPEGFGLAEHERLAEHFRLLAARGVSVILSNSDTPYSRELYQGFDIREVRVARSINNKGDKRGKVGELIISAGFR